jgi:hypothetical protein
MTLNKQQAADALYISIRTLDRRMKDGSYKYTRTGEGQWAEVTFTYADLGLPEPKEIPLPYQDERTPQTIAVPKPALMLRPLSPMEKKEAEDRAFAADYLAGNATDSYGNTIDETNPNCPTAGVQCGVTKPPVETPVTKETQSHMNPALLGDHDSSGNPLDPEFKMDTREYFDNKNGAPLSVGYTRSGVTLCEGLPQELYDAMMHKWERSNGAPSESEMAAKVRRDKALMREAFLQRNATTASRGLAQ